MNFRELWEAFSLNPQWCGDYGPNGEAPLIREEKSQVCAVASKDLTTLYEEKGDDYFSEAWVSIQRDLVVQNWFTWAKDKRGQRKLLPMVVLWKQILARGKGRAEKQTTGRSVLDQLSEGLLKK